MISFLAQQQLQRNFQIAGGNPRLSRSLPSLFNGSRVAYLGDMLEGHVILNTDQNFNSYTGERMRLSIDWEQPPPRGQHSLTALESLNKEIKELDNIINSDGILEPLINKSKGNFELLTPEEQTKFRRRLSSLISDKIDDNYIFKYHDYDSQNKDPFAQNGPRVTKLNNLTRGNTSVCDMSTLVEGVITTKFLTTLFSDTAPKLYALSGYVQYPDEAPEFHAYLMYEDGDIVETTSKKGESPYRTNMENDYTILNAIAGQPAIVKDREGNASVYGDVGFTYNKEAIHKVKERMEILKKYKSPLDISPLDIETLEKLRLTDFKEKEVIQDSFNDLLCHHNLKRAGALIAKEYLINLKNPDFLSVDFTTLDIRNISSNYIKGESLSELETKLLSKTQQFLKSHLKEFSELRIMSYTVAFHPDSIEHKDARLESLVAEISKSGTTLSFDHDQFDQYQGKRTPDYQITCKKDTWEILKK